MIAVARHLVLVIGILSVARAQVATGLKKAWGLDLAKWQVHGTNSTRYAVTGLSFSADGKRIALAGDEGITENGTTDGRLLVLTIGDAGSVKVFRQPGGGRDPDWSPDGTSIIINQALVKIEKGGECELPPLSGFLSENLEVGERREAQSADKEIRLGDRISWKTRIITYDLDCQPVAEWQTSKEWNILDVSTGRRLILMNQHLVENLLVDPADGHVVRRWSVGTWPVWDGPTGYFADQGKALCGVIAGGFETVPLGKHVRCWNADTGVLIDTAPADRAGGPIAVSKESTRIVFSEYGYIRGVVRDLDSHPYQGASVWDYASGRKLASWRPATQTWYQMGLRPPKKITEPSKLAISPDGQFVAEGGDGKLTIYRVQP